MLKVPTILSLDATPVNFDRVGREYGHHRSPTLLHSAKEWLNRRVFTAASALVSFSHWAADSLVDDYHMPRDKVNVIRSGVDLELLSVPDRGNRQARIRVLFVGGDFERKGGPDLMAAMEPLAERAELDVVSNAVIPQNPSRLRCRLHRGLAAGSAELTRLFREADVFALPSHADCSPHAIAEALASGLPVVACPVGAVHEMVRDGVNGFLVPPSSTTDLTRALEKLIDCAPLRHSMGLHSRLLAEQEHDMQRNHEAILELMLRLADRHAA